MIMYKCDNCGNEIERENKRKIVIFEQLRQKHNNSKWGHYRMELCLTCLEKIGYHKFEERYIEND